MEKKELKELIKALLLVSLEAYKVQKDGISTADIMVIVNDLLVNEANRQVLLDGVKGAANIPAEVKSYTMADWIELVIWLSSQIPAVIEQAKK